MLDHHVAIDASITLGSVLRQTSRHADARLIDQSALENATDDGRRAHARISLAADAVGLADVPACRKQLVAAARIVPTRAWRARVRLAWVTCEHALMIDDQANAIKAARDALARSRRAHARRHEAKSLLFLGVSLRTAGRTGDREALAGARDLARELGARPIERVAATALRAPG